MAVRAARRALVTFLALLAALVAAPVAAGPTGGQVVAGSGSIQRPDADTTLIRQQTQAMAIHWNAFDVAGHELVQFQQPSASSAVLNRVLNELPSQIHGRIEANGQVFIMNPNGVVFGPGSRVEVGGLIASSLDLDVQDFMAGHYRFTSSDGAGAVINRGLIKAATGGTVALLGGTVRNDGVIVADLGRVLMGAGRQALVDFDGDGLIRFQVDEGLLAESVPSEGAVVNNGEIRADGGQVLLSAAAARGIVDKAVNNAGVIRAAGIDRSGGTVRLTALGGGVANAGVIDVSASGADGEGGRVILESTGLTLLDAGSRVAADSPGGRGGRVRVLGESVAMLDGAVVDVSGGYGGGAVLVGGDYQGANPAVANARRTGVAAGARIAADATVAGHGGRVIVWSDEATNFFGRISARGGEAGGDGGFAEVSGKQQLTYRGTSDLSAPAGVRGTLLLDPATIEIVGGSGDGDSDGGAGSAAGAILFSEAGPSVVYQSELEAQSATADIALQATRSITTRGTFTNGALTLARDSSLLLETRNAGTAETGLINLLGSTSGTGLDIVTSGSGTITVRSGVGGDRHTPILLPNLISASDITLSAGGGTSSAVIVFGEVSGRNVDVDATGSVIVVSGARLVGGGDGTALTIDADGITVLDGQRGAATIGNSGTGTVSLTSAGGYDVLLGDYAIATDVGLLSVNAGRSILAVNLTDLSDTVNEITSAGTVSLQAAGDIGRAANEIEIGGASHLDLLLDHGSFHVSGSDGAGGPGSALSGLSLTLHPDRNAAYVLENFAGQTFDLATWGGGNDLAIRSLTSASPMDLSVTTLGHGMTIGDAGGGGIRLHGASPVMLDSGGGIHEAVVDDGGAVRAEVTTDGRLTLVANGTIGASGMLDVAAATPGGVAALEAASTSGSVRVNGVEDLRVEGSGIRAPRGGRLSAARGLTIAAHVEAGAGMTFTATGDGALAGNDLRIDSGAVVSLDSSQAAVLAFEAGDHIHLDGGRIETRGGGAHRVALLADRESGGADGVTGDVTDSGAAPSVSTRELAVVAGGIGVGAALGVQVSGDLYVQSRSTGAAGDIRLRQHGDLATSQLKQLKTDPGSAQTVVVAADNRLLVDQDFVHTPDLQSGDVVELDAARIQLAEKISGKDVDLRFRAPVDVTRSALIHLDEGLLTFHGNVSPGANTTLTIESRVALASGRVTGQPGSTLVVKDTLDLVTDTTIAVDNLFLSGRPGGLTGNGDLTLLPATHGKDIVIGGREGLVPDVTVATLQGFGGGRALNIGVPAFPISNAPFAGNVTVERSLSVGDATLTVGGLGDVILTNPGEPLESSRAINVVAVGDRRVFPGLVTHDGGDILDTDPRGGDLPTLKAPTVNLIAQGRVGDASNALKVAVGVGGRVNFVTGAEDAFVNTIPPGQGVNNVVDTSPVLAAFQAQGFFLDPLSQAAVARTVGLETTGLETTGLGELLYIDEGVFLLPNPYTMPIQAALLPVLMDPDLPVDRRPDDPNDEEGWQAFYDGALKDFVRARYLLPEDASAEESADTQARIDSEWQGLVTYFEALRGRERDALADGSPGVGSGG